jgi:hypothetical protein
MDNTSTSKVVEKWEKAEAALTAPTKPAGVAPSSNADSPRQHRTRIEAHALEAHERVIAEAEAKHLPPPAVVDYFVREEFWADYRSNGQRFKARAKEALAWLVGVVAAASLPKKVQHAARQLLAVKMFTINMAAIGIWDSLKSQVKSKLQELGTPLGVHFVANGVGQQLGSIHTSITMHNACAAGSNARQGLPNTPGRKKVCSAPPPPPPPLMGEENVVEGKFIDPNFPPDSSSLGDKLQGKDWLRASDMGAMELYQSGVGGNGYRWIP